MTAEDIERIRAAAENEVYWGDTGTYRLTSECVLDLCDLALEGLAARDIWEQAARVAEAVPAVTIPMWDRPGGPPGNGPGRPTTPGEIAFAIRAAALAHKEAEE